MVHALQDVDLYSKRITAADKIIRRIRQVHRYINFRSPFDFIPGDGHLAASTLQIFLFVDAGYAALPGQ